MKIKKAGADRILINDSPMEENGDNNVSKRRKYIDQRAHRGRKIAAIIKLQRTQGIY